MSRAAENPRAEAACEGKTFPLFLLLEIRAKVLGKSRGLGLLGWGRDRK